MAKQTFSVGQVLTAAQMTSLQQTAMGGGAASAKTANYVLVAADAGTTISMTSTSATTITVNTGLFAAGDTVFIQNLGSGTCTITAGTATVNTAGSLILPQYDAGILYFVSASSAIFYDYIQVGATSPLTTKGDLYVYGSSDTRLPVGANGTTLVADSSTATGLKWDTASSGSMTVIQSGNLTGSAIAVTGISGYKDLRVVLRNYYPSISGEAAYFRLNNVTTTIYNNSMIKSASTSIDNTTASTTFGLDDNLRSPINTSQGNAVMFNVYDIANTTAVKLVDYQHRYYNVDSVKRWTKNFGYWDSTAAVTEVNINMGGGASFSGGTYIVYGVN